MILIGLNGLPGAGKDTIAGILRDTWGFHPVSFARHIRREFSNGRWVLQSGVIVPTEVRAMLTQFGRDRIIKELTDKPTSHAARVCMQWFGEFWYQRDPMHWVSQVACEIRDCQNDRVVISDVRRQVEVDLVHDYHGHLYKVTRRDNLPMPSDLRSHVTETELDGYHFRHVIKNSGSMTQLHAMVGDVVQHLMDHEYDSH